MDLTRSDAQFLLLILASGVGFAALIVGCLTYRARLERRLSEVDPAALLARLGLAAPPASLLIGAPETGWQSAGFVLRDASGQVVGRIRYRLAGGAELELGGDRHEVRMTGADWTSTELRSPDGDVRCNKSGSRWKTGTSIYRLPGGEELAVEGSLGSMWRRDYPILAGEARVGRVVDMGSASVPGQVVVLLDRPLELPALAFVLACEARRVS